MKNYLLGIAMFFGVFIMGYMAHPIRESRSEDKPEATFKLPADALEVVSITRNRNGDWVVGYKVNSSLFSYKAIQYGPGDKTFVTEFHK